MTIETKDKETIVADMLADILTEVTDVTDVNVGSVLRQLVDTFASELSNTDGTSLYEKLEEVYDATRVTTATSTDLEEIGKIVGITRNTGTKTSGYVTFIRTQPATSNFTIDANKIVSTAPNTGETQYKFLVKADTTFEYDIDNEEHTFIDGIYEYAMDERLINSIDEITGTVSSSSHTFTATTDYELTQSFDGYLETASSNVTLDDCDATTGWSASTDAATETLDTSNQRQGTACLNLGKTGTSSDTFYYEKTLSSTQSIISKDFIIDVYIKDSTELAKIKQMDLYIGSGGSIASSYQYTISNSNLSVGWNRYYFDYTQYSSNSNITKNGNPNTLLMNHLRVSFTTNNSSDTITLGDIKMDFIRLGEIYAYKGDIVTWTSTGTRPDDNTTIYCDYTPLSKEVEVEAESVGSEYNVSAEKINYMVSTFSQIDSVLNYEAFTNGTSEETDTALRQRIQNAASLAGKATVESIKQAVLAVDGIVSVSAEDMPTQSISDEAHVFHTGTDDYVMGYEIIQDNSNFVISNSTGGSADYTKGTDYTVNEEDNKISWISGGSKPSDGATFYCNYDIRRLGWLQLYVVGENIPMGSSKESEVDDAIDDARSAGIKVEWDEPTVINQNVTLTVLADTDNGYTFSAIQNNVDSAIESLLENMEVGEDLYLASIIDTVMEVEGVKNCSITVPSSDVTVNNNQVIRKGTITSSSM